MDRAPDRRRFFDHQEAPVRRHVVAVGRIQVVVIAAGEQHLRLGFASFPNGLVKGPDGALYTSNQGISFAPGDGSVLRIVP